MLLTHRRGQPSIVLGRCVFILGILAVLLNIIRIIRIYDNSRGVMLLANVIVLVSILVGFRRNERSRVAGAQSPQASDVDSLNEER